MTTPRTKLRGVLASGLGALAACGVLHGLARLGHLPWLSPGAAFRAWVRGSTLGSWALTAGLAAGVAGLYTAWFDGLFRGNGASRGLKFGALAWGWSLVSVSVAQGYGVAGVHSPWPLAYALTSMASWLVLGLVTGLLYGGMHDHDEYVAGLGYGLPDRHSLG